MKHYLNKEKNSSQLDEVGKIVWPLGQVFKLKSVIEKRRRKINQQDQAALVPQQKIAARAPA